MSNILTLTLHLSQECRNSLGLSADDLSIVRLGRRGSSADRGEWLMMLILIGDCEVGEDPNQEPKGYSQ